MFSPSRSLLIGLFLTPAIVSLALVGFGWRLLEQQRAIDRDSARRQLDSDADATVARIRERLAEAGERLGASLSPSNAALPTLRGMVTVVAGDRGIDVRPRDALEFRDLNPSRAAASGPRWTSSFTVAAPQRPPPNARIELQSLHTRSNSGQRSRGGL